MAPGSQTWNGNCADLVAAATRIRIAAQFAVDPVTGPISPRRAVPAASTNSTKPASSDRPPPAVITSARRAAVLATGSTCLNPTSRNDVIEVSSQKTNRVQTDSAQTSPTIAVENASSVAAKRPMLVALGVK